MDTISAHGSVTSMLLLENYDRPTNQPNHPTDEPTDGQGGSFGSFVKLRGLSSTRSEGGKEVEQVLGRL